MLTKHTRSITVDNWTVQLVGSSAGYFEHDLTGTGGNIRFDMRDRLEDYDGVFALPAAVIKAIRALGKVVPREFQ